MASTAVALQDLPATDAKLVRYFLLLFALHFRQNATCLGCVITGPRTRTEDLERLRRRQNMLCVRLNHITNAGRC